MESPLQAQIPRHTSKVQVLRVRCADSRAGKAQKSLGSVPLGISPTASSLEHVAPFSDEFDEPK